MGRFWPEWAAKWTKSQATGINWALGGFCMESHTERWNRRIKYNNTKGHRSEERRDVFLQSSNPASIIHPYCPTSTQNSFVNLSPVCRTALPFHPLSLSLVFLFLSSFSFFSADNEFGLGQEFVILVIPLPHKDENPHSVEQYSKCFIYITERTMTETPDCWILIMACTGLHFRHESRAIYNKKIRCHA